MNIVILATARGLRPASLLAIREQLGVVAGADEVTVVSAHRPYRPLPVDANLWAGADLTLRRWAKVLPVAPLGDSDTPAHSADTSDGADGADGAAGSRGPGQPLRRRLAHGLAWRARRVRFAVRDHPQVSRVRNSTKVRRTTNAVTPGGPSARFAVNVMRARNVQDALALADVVVALDSNAHRAAWLVSRRHRRPDVVVGTAAGRRVLAARRAVG